MKKMIILLFILAGCTKPVEIEPVEEIDYSECHGKGFTYSEELSYDLVWSDEFDEDGSPNSEYWKYDTGGSGWGNNELQYYTEDNVMIKDGILEIEARQEEYSNRQYTSTRLVSQNEGSFLYGIVEVRAKLPEGVGTWPAIWMLPTNLKYGGWPHSGEIDIMEHVGYEMNKIHGTVHTATFNHNKNSQKGSSMLVEDVANTFHVYKIEWLPDKINFFIDDEQYFSFENKWLECPTSKEWPFDQEFHLLLNIAVGGDWGGQKGVDEDIWPQTMEIDYVRLYQSQEITNLAVK